MPWRPKWSTAVSRRRRGGSRGPSPQSAASLGKGPGDPLVQAFGLELDVALGEATPYHRRDGAHRAGLLDAEGQLGAAGIGNDLVPGARLHPRPLGLPREASTVDDLAHLPHCTRQPGLANPGPRAELQLVEPAGESQTGRQLRDLKQRPLHYASNAWARSATLRRTCAG